MTTTVTIAVNEFTASGPVALLGHSITFKPIPIHIDSTTDTVLSEDIWEVAIVDGVSTTLIPDSVSGYGVRIGANIQGWKFVTVANYPVGTISLADLVNNYAVNPTTLEPTPAPDSWWTALNNLVDNSVAIANQYTDEQVADITTGIDADIAAAKGEAITAAATDATTKANAAQAAATSSSNGYTDTAVALRSLKANGPVNAKDYGQVGLLSTLTAAIAAAEARGKHTILYVPAGVWDVGNGLSLSGKSVVIVGDGPNAGTTSTPTGTIFYASSQTGPVIDFNGWVCPSPGWGSKVHFREFGIKGSGAADATLANAGMRFVTLNGVTFSDIVIRNTGGPCLDFQASNSGAGGNSNYINDFERFTLEEPISMQANDVPFFRSAESNANRFVGFILRSQSLARLTAPSGAVQVLAGSTYSGERNVFDSWRFEALVVPDGGTLFNHQANLSVIQNFQFEDCLKVAGVANTSFFRFDNAGAGNIGANLLTGIIPGTDGSATNIDVGVDVRQSKNKISGVKGAYQANNVVIASGVTYTDVDLGGTYSAVALRGVVDLSGNQTNTIRDAALLQFPGGGTGIRRTVSGRYYGAANHSLATGAFSNGYLMAIPFWLPIAASFNEIDCEVTTLASSTNVRMGIYANDPAKDAPGALVLDAGTVDASTVGVKPLAITKTLQAGLYWLGAVAQGGNPNLRVCVGNLAPVAGTAFVGAATNAEDNCFYMSSVTGALPANWSATLTTVSGGPKIALRAS